jgi:DNA-binding XRE family transcriptional regulator
MPQRKPRGISTGDLTPEQRAAIEAIRAKRRTPEARAEELRVRAAVMEEFLPAKPDRDTRAALDVLCRERKRLGLSLTDVSERSGLDRATISKLENGHIPNPTLRTLNLYAHALGKRLKVTLAEG